MRRSASAYCAIAGADTPLASRIIAVVDAYDAMTEDRTYRIRLDAGDAIAELLRCSSVRFDPQVVAHSSPSSDALIVHGTGSSHNRTLSRA